MGASARSRCAHHEDEGRADAPGAQGGAGGGCGDRSRGGGDGAGGRSGRHADVQETLCEAGEQVATVAGEAKSEGVNPQGPKEIVLDKGYHSSEVLVKL